MRPPRKVPVVRTTARTGIILPRCVTTPVTFCRIPLRAASLAYCCSSMLLPKLPRRSPGIVPASALESEFGGSGVEDAVVKISITVSINVYRFGVCSQILRASWE